YRRSGRRRAYCIASPGRGTRCATMSSPVHNVLAELLEVHPEALVYLLAVRTRIGTPDSELLQGPFVPTTGTRTKTVTLERHVDRVFLGGKRKALKGFVLAEIQLDTDDDKRFSWPLYVELGRSRYRCEGALVVLTVDAAVRRWIERVIVPP